VLWGFDGDDGFFSLAGLMPIRRAIFTARLAAAARIGEGTAFKLSMSLP